MGAQRFQRKGCGSKRTEPNDIAGVPWASNVTGLSLGDEMRKYKEFMVPCEEEMKARSVVRAVVQEKVSLICPGATVKRCGEAGINMASFQQGISLVVEDINETLIPLAVEELCSLDTNAISTSASMLLHINNIPTAIHLTPDTRSYHRALTAYVKKELAQHPAAEYTAFVLTSILESCKIINDKFTSMTFLILVLGYAKMAGGGVPPGAFMKGFMEYMGKTFEAGKHMIDLSDAKGIVDVPAYMADQTFIILDPVSGVNLVADAHASLPIRLKLTMQNCLSHMSVTENDLATRVPSSVGPRSVLSTVIAYHEYWPRTFRFQREGRSRPPSPTVSCTTFATLSSDDESEVFSS